MSARWFAFFAACESSAASASSRSACSADASLYCPIANGVGGAAALLNGRVAIRVAVARL